MRIQTIILLLGGRFTGFHELSGAMDPKDAYKGAQIALATFLKDVSTPLIGKQVCN